MAALVVAGASPSQPAASAGTRAPASEARRHCIQPGTGREPPRLQGLHRVRLGRIRRPVVQPVLLRGAQDAEELTASRSTRSSPSPTTSTSDNIHAMVDEGCDSHLRSASCSVTPPRPPRGQPDGHFAIIDFGYEKPTAEPQGPYLRHRPGFLPRGLPGRRGVGDRHRRHLRWPQHPDRDDLHGRLPPGRRGLQRGEGHGRQGPWLGQGKRTAPSPRTSKRRTRASRSPQNFQAGR